MAFFSPLSTFLLSLRARLSFHVPRIHTLEITWSLVHIRDR